jgi:NADH:ubiquinone oxidoreductase subunit 3 (subunit A)
VRVLSAVLVLVLVLAATIDALEVRRLLEPERANPSKLK